MTPRNRTPANAPQTVPRPPETAMPPTTAAAMTLSSRPLPSLGSTLRNWIAVRSAAKAASAPIRTKTPKTTRRGRMPASRAASASEPTA